MMPIRHHPVKVLTSTKLPCQMPTLLPMRWINLELVQQHQMQRNNSIAL